MSFVSRVSQLQRLALTAIAGTLFVITARAAHAQDTTLDSHARGSHNAPVTVYEMADFQCPYCRDFATQTFPTLEQEYVKTGKVRWIFINFPLTSIHPNAQAAAEFAACASRQGKFWQVHDMLYGTQDKWETLKNPAPYFISQYLPLGIHSDAMDKCLQSGAGRVLVRDDVAGAERAGASSTPTFYIEGGIMSGSQPLQVFRVILDSIYRKKTAKK